MPQMGESVTEGTVLGWLKAVGDRVEADEPLVEVSTDKVDTEIPAPAAGTLMKILVEADSRAAVGDVLGEIEVSEGGDVPAVPDPEREGGAELVEVTFPQMGDSVTEGTVLEWRKQVGDSVMAEETLVEISTDKVDAEVPAPVAGTVAEILADPDSTVSVGSVLCRIAAGAPQAAAASAPRPREHAPEVRPAGTPPGGGNGDLNATPVALRIAGAHGVDVGSLRGSGPRGRVTKDDVLAAVEGNGAPAGPAAATSAPEHAETRPIRGPAATLVRFMNESRDIPTATSFRSVPVDTLDGRRRALKLPASACRSRT